MSKIVSSPERFEVIVVDGSASERLQLFLDDLQQRLNDFLLGQAVRIPIYTVASIPSVSENFSSAEFSSLIYVSDETGGAVIAFTDGTNWRRVTARAVVA